MPYSDILRMESFESCLCMLNWTVFLLEDVCFLAIWASCFSAFLAFLFFVSENLPEAPL